MRLQPHVCVPLGLILRTTTYRAGPKHKGETPQQYFRRVANIADRDGTQLKKMLSIHPDFIGIVMRHHAYISNRAGRGVRSSTGLSNVCQGIKNRERFIDKPTLRLIDAVSSKVGKYKGKRVR